MENQLYPRSYSACFNVVKTVKYMYAYPIIILFTCTSWLRFKVSGPLAYFDKAIAFLTDKEYYYEGVYFT